MIYYKVSYELKTTVKKSLNEADMKGVVQRIREFNRRELNKLENKYNISNYYAEEKKTPSFVDKFGDRVAKYLFYSICEVVNNRIVVLIAFRNRSKATNLVDQVELIIGKEFVVDIQRRHPEEISTSEFGRLLRWGLKNKYIPEVKYTKSLCKFIGFAAREFGRIWAGCRAENTISKKWALGIKNYKKQVALQECDYLCLDDSAKCAIDAIYSPKKKEDLKNSLPAVTFIKAANRLTGRNIVDVLHKANLQQKFISSNNINIFDVAISEETNKEFTEKWINNLYKCEGSTVVLDVTRTSQYCTKEGLTVNSLRWFFARVYAALESFGKRSNLIVLDYGENPSLIKTFSQKPNARDKFVVYTIFDNNNEEKYKIDNRAESIELEMKENFLQQMEKENADKNNLPTESDNRKSHLKSGIEGLNNLVNMSSLKASIENMVATYELMDLREKYQGFKRATTYNILLKGEPGTGKSEALRFLVDILYGIGIGKNNQFSILRKPDIIGNGTVGDTENFIKEYLEENKCSFIIVEDFHEFDDRNEVGKTAIETLFSEIEKHNYQFSVICVGHTKSVNYLLDSSTGLKSYFDLVEEIGALSSKELLLIAKSMLAKKSFVITKEVEERLLKIFDAYCLEVDFTNGHFVEELISQAINKQSLRLRNELKDKFNCSKAKDKKKIKNKLSTLTVSDFEVQLCNDLFEKTPGVDAKDALNNIVGLENVKSMLNNIVSENKVSKVKSELMGEAKKNNMHMCFYGNPGSAKTTIARIVAQLLKEEGILRTGKFVEIDRSGLVDKYLGHTARNVKEKFHDAAGGVLFIDEAYGLCMGERDEFGNEALDSLVKEMEDHRDDVVVILAGYPDKMQNFMQNNEGLKSRIAYQVNFDNYSIEELVEILKLMAKERNFKLNKGFVQKAKKAFAKVINFENFSNGRFVRNMLELAITKQAVRIKDEISTEIDKRKIKRILTTIKAEDFDVNVMEEFSQKEIVREDNKIGFN